MRRCLDWQFDQLPLWTSYDDFLHVARKCTIDHILDLEHSLTTSIQWALVTATILVTSGVSENKWQILVGRVLNYIYIGMELSSVPVYQSEVVRSLVNKSVDQPSL